MTSESKVALHFPPLFQIKMSENQGFKNTNNRCFAIVAVQMIYSNVDLLNFIQDAKTPTLVKKGKGDLLRELRRLTTSTSTKKEDLGIVLKIVAKGKYNDGRQHDAPEFYDAVIDTLREEIKKEDQDILDVIVLSLVEENRKCIKCGKCDTKYEKVYSHRIPAYDATFVENFKLYFKTIQQVRRCSNRSCDSQKFELESKIVRSPQMLVVCLKRFEVRNETECISKISKPISTPPQFNVNQTDFFLRCSVIHSGKLFVCCSLLKFILLCCTSL